VPHLSYHLCVSLRSPRLCVSAVKSCCLIFCPVKSVFICVHLWCFFLLSPWLRLQSFANQFAIRRRAPVAPLRLSRGRRLRSRDQWESRARRPARVQSDGEKGWSSQWKAAPDGANGWNDEQ